MPYSSGTFSRVHDFTDDRDNGIRIQASRMDAEMDGIATGLSTALLKDGTQTATAKIPFAVGLSVIDNQTILLGTNSDIAIQYDETTNDSLEISANVEGAALGIVLKSDQGDDNADQHKLSIADGGTLTLGSKISGSFVTYLTHTPNATVASSTLAVAGNLTVGGNLTLGSGAELSEAELEMLDGITAGTVAASKAVVVDANKDIASFRNITLTGELDAGSLDVSGNVDIDGTLETDALSIASTAVTATAAELNYNDTGAAVGTVVASKTVTVDANKDVSSFRNITLTGELDAGSLDVSGDADIDGTLEADAMTLNGTAITTVATLSTGISNGNLPVFTSGVADDDFLRVNGTSIEGRSASEVLSDIGASAVAGSSSIVTTGALNSGSITSGFGTIDNGTSTLTTGNSDINGTLNVQGETTLQTHLNMGDNDIIKVGDSADLQIYHDGSNSYIDDTGTGILWIRGDASVRIGKAGTTEVGLRVESDSYTKLYYDNAEKLATTSTGIDVTGTVVSDGMSTNTAGTSNFRAGVSAGSLIGSGANYNTFVGDRAGRVCSSGDNNVAIGFESLDSEIGGGASVAVGYQALLDQNTSNTNYNTAVGFQSGKSITTGIQNTLIGGLAGDALTDADLNVALGYFALSSDTLGGLSTAIGYQALKTQNFTSATSTYNVAVGYNAGVLVTTGVSNTLIGARAGDALTDADYNVALGDGALSSDTKGSRSVAIGNYTLENQNFTSATNTYNTAVGNQAGNDITTGIQNTLIGGLAGQALSDADFNVAIGINTLQADTKGSKSVAIGDSALGNQNFTSSTDTFNIAIGYSAGVAITTGIQNTLIGSLAGDTITDGVGNICIGKGADVASASHDYSITIGRDVTSIGEYYFTFGVDSSVHRVYNSFISNATWTRVSDERIKKDITANTDCGLDFINDLRTVTYKFKAPSELDPTMAGYDASKTEPIYQKKMYGFVAQEVKSAMDTHSITDFNAWHQIEDGGDNMQGISYEMFVMPLVKAVQELSAKNDALEARIVTLEGE